MEALKASVAAAKKQAEPEARPPGAGASEARRPAKKTAAKKATAKKSTAKKTTARKKAVGE